MNRSLSAAVLAVALVLGGCTDATSEPPAAPDDAGSRVEQIRDLRQEVAGPAVAIGRAGAQVASAVGALRTEPPTDPETRLATISTVRSEAITQLERTLEDADAIVLPGHGPDARAVSHAWSSVLDAAAGVLETSRAELDHVQRLANADVTLGEVIAVWERPGSRREQLAAFDEAASHADALAAELAGLEPHVACLGDLQRRVNAAEFVAAATRELRRSIANHHGNTFDRRRAELAEDPYGVGGSLATVPEPGCWQEQSPTAQSADELTSGLRTLEQALNPPDVATSGDTPG